MEKWSYFGANPAHGRRTKAKQRCESTSVRVLLTEKYCYLGASPPTYSALRQKEDVNLLQIRRTILWKRGELLFSPRTDTANLTT